MKYKRKITTEVTLYVLSCPPFTSKVWRIFVCYLVNTIHTYKNECTGLYWEFEQWNNEKHQFFCKISKYSHEVTIKLYLKEILLCTKFLPHDFFVREQLFKKGENHEAIMFKKIKIAEKIYSHFPRCIFSDKERKNNQKKHLLRAYLPSGSYARSCEFHNVYHLTSPNKVPNSKIVFLWFPSSPSEWAFIDWTKTRV